MKYKAIIFDVGDTLLEHYPSQEKIYSDRLKQIGFEIDSNMAKKMISAITAASNEQITKEQNGAPRMSDEDFYILTDRAALSCIEAEKDEDECLKKLSQIPVPETELRIIPHTIETLEILKQKYRLGIVSNHKVWLPEYLKKLGLADFFETIIVSEIVGVEKPDVKIMELALENLSLDAESCLYVGDHPFDVLCAKGAGIDCAWLTEKDSVLPESIPFTEDYRINGLCDLIEILM